MTKPRLPPEIQALLPHCIVKHIHSFIPSLPPIQPMIKGLQRELKKLERGTKQNTMYLYGLIE